MADSIEIVFQRGAFDTNSTMLTTKPFLVYSTGLVFFAIETILVIFYYSKADTKTPVFVGIVCVVINILLTWIFIQFLGYIGIALALVIQKAIKNIVLLLLLKHKIEFSTYRLWKVLMKILGAAIIFTLMALTGKFLFNNFADNSLLKVVALVVIFTFSGAIYMAILYFSKAIKTGKSVISNA